MEKQDEMAGGDNACHWTVKNSNKKKKKHPKNKNNSNSSNRRKILKQRQTGFRKKDDEAFKTANFIARKVQINNHRALQYSSVEKSEPALFCIKNKIAEFKL